MRGSVYKKRKTSIVYRYSRFCTIIFQQDHFLLDLPASFQDVTRKNIVLFYIEVLKSEKLSQNCSLEKTLYITYIILNITLFNADMNWITTAQTQVHLSRHICDIVIVSIIFFVSPMYRHGSLQPANFNIPSSFLLREYYFVIWFTLVFSSS